MFSEKEMGSLSDAHRLYRFLLPKRSYMRFQMVHETISATEERGGVGDA